MRLRGILPSNLLGTTDGIVGLRATDRFAIMAIRFRSNLDTLVNDLLRGGYTVECATTVPGGRGRSFDVHLGNGAVVNWDTHTRCIWAEGAPRQARSIERYLTLIYEGTWLTRLFTIEQRLWKARVRMWKRRRAERKAAEAEAARRAALTRPVYLGVTARF